MLRTISVNNLRPENIVEKWVYNIHCKVVAASFFAGQRVEGQSYRPEFWWILMNFGDHPKSKNSKLSTPWDHSNYGITLSKSIFSFHKTLFQLLFVGGVVTSLTYQHPFFTIDVTKICLEFYIQMSDNCFFEFVQFNWVLACSSLEGKYFEPCHFDCWCSSA